MCNLNLFNASRVTSHCTEEKEANARAHDFLHYPVKSSNANGGYNFVPPKTCTTASFMKCSYHMKEFMWTFDTDRVNWNNHRKHAQHGKQLYITTNYYCSELRNLCPCQQDLFLICLVSAICSAQTVEWVVLRKNILNFFCQNPRFHGKKKMPTILRINAILC